jgi:hypothetical protein
MHKHGLLHTITIVPNLLKEWHMPLSIHRISLLKTVKLHTSKNARDMYKGRYISASTLFCLFIFFILHLYIKLSECIVVILLFWWPTSNAASLLLTSSWRTNIMDYQELFKKINDRGSKNSQWCLTKKNNVISEPIA